MPAPNWSQEDISLLREMRANGDSLCFIARVLNRHRGTIANKCKRLGLPLSDKVGRRLSADPAAPKRRKMVKLPPPAPLPPFEMLHLPLVELAEPQCHFPLGDGPFTFCGHETCGATYCDFHTVLAYRTATQ